MNFKPNKLNVLITLAYIILSWIPMFKVTVNCITAPCPQPIYPFVFMLGAGGLWYWLLSVIIIYVIVSLFKK